MKAFLIFLFLLLSPLLSVDAKYLPLEVPNNKYGIHLADPNDVRDAAQLVNSTGGEWGYVTIVIEQNDRKIEKWQPIFDQMRRVKLIPIVRLATYLDGDKWATPHETTFDEWIDFLNKLNWVVENRYVVLFNEPNHAKEWGGTLNPEEYADRFVTLARKLKESHHDFYILPAGFDVAASNDGRSMDAFEYIRRVVGKRPEFLELIDGWTSHAYPNPAFSAHPLTAGRRSMWSYENELALLKELGLTRYMPVFITETGWLHNEGVAFDASLRSPEELAQFMPLAAGGPWDNDLIVAITPFVFNYQGIPFDHFSWKKLQEDEYYPHYYAYQDIPKLIGKPRQRSDFTLLKPIIPETLVASSSYVLRTPIKNTGQSIVETPNNHTFIIHAPDRFEIHPGEMPPLEPGEQKLLTYEVITPNDPGTYNIGLTLKLESGEQFPLQNSLIQIVPPPSIHVSTRLGWRMTSDATDVEILIYDGDELIHKFDNLVLQDGGVLLPDVRGIVPGQEYRIVMLVPYYLPRQTIQKLSGRRTDISMDRHLPLDLNLDGKLTFDDVLKAFSMQPQFVIRLFTT